MSAPQFSSKMLKTSKNLLSEKFSCKDKVINFAHFVNFSLGENLLKTSLLTKMRDFETIKTSKTWKDKFYLLCELLVW